MINYWYFNDCLSRSLLLQSIFFHIEINVRYKINNSSDKQKNPRSFRRYPTSLNIFIITLSKRIKKKNI